MNETVHEIIFSTPRDRIQEIRKIAKNFVEDYREFLNLPDQEIIRLQVEENHYFRYILYCQICGKGFAIDECFALLKFSFCDYGCFSELSMHLNCSKLVERIEHE